MEKDHDSPFSLSSTRETGKIWNLVWPSHRAISHCEIKVERQIDTYVTIKICKTGVYEQRVHNTYLKKDRRMVRLRYNHTETNYSVLFMLSFHFSFFQSSSNFNDVNRNVDPQALDQMVRKKWEHDFRQKYRSVSYTHLTLPTIYSV